MKLLLLFILYAIALSAALARAGQVDFHNASFFTTTQLRKPDSVKPNRAFVFH
jgi:hypothetical protein